MVSMVNPSEATPRPRPVFGVIVSTEPPSLITGRFDSVSFQPDGFFAAWFTPLKGDGPKDSANAPRSLSRLLIAPSTRLTRIIGGGCARFSKEEATSGARQPGSFSATIYRIAQTLCIGVNKDGANIEKNAKDFFRRDAGVGSQGRHEQPQESDAGATDGACQESGYRPLEEADPLRIALEIERVKNQLRDGHPDVEGLMLALHDWRGEMWILEGE